MTEESFMKKKSKDYMDPHTTTSDKKGIWGVFEAAIRSFRGLGFILMIAPIMGLYILCLGISLALPIYLSTLSYQFLGNYSLPWLSLGMGVTLAASYFLFALTLILVVPLINFLLPLRLKPMRTTWFSLEVIPWYYHNALVQLVRYTVLDFLTPTPINVLFFRLMGMKIGKNVMINTTNISDPCLITLEDNVTIGGSATIFAHYGMKGFLIVEETIIKKGVTVGLKASIMGDVVIGEYAMIPPHEVLLPKTRLEAKHKYEKKKKGLNTNKKKAEKLKESA